MKRYELKTILSKSKDGSLVKFEDVEKELQERGFNELLTSAMDGIEPGANISINIKRGQIRINLIRDDSSEEGVFGSADLGCSFKGLIKSSYDTLF